MYKILFTQSASGENAWRENEILVNDEKSIHKYYRKWEKKQKWLKRRVLRRL